MKFRLAKPSDCRQLTRVYIACAAEDEAEAEGFALKLGRRYLQQYYRMLMSEKNSVVVCAVDDKDTAKVLGFASGSLDASESMRAFRKHRFRLFLAAFFAIICQPQLIVGMVRRYKATFVDERGEQDEQYVISSGARLTYWGMLPSARSGPGGLVLLHKWLQVMHLLGARNICAELNRGNARAQQVHRMFGAKVVKEIVTPDGKPRMIVKYP